MYFAAKDVRNQLNPAESFSRWLRGVMDLTQCDWGVVSAGEHPGSGSRLEAHGVCGTAVRIGWLGSEPATGKRCRLCCPLLGPLPNLITAAKMRESHIQNGD